MALNPKLNVYVVRLNPKNRDSFSTFRDLFRLKFSANEQTNDTTIQESFFNEFLNLIGKTDYRIDSKCKKVIGVSSYNETDDHSSLALHSNNNIIEGIIDGGNFGILRAIADVHNKNGKTDLGTNNAVLDKFYICFCTPLNSSIGFLLIQSYTEASIQEPIKNFIVDLLRNEEAFYNAIIEPYVPQKFVERFQRDAHVRMFSFHTKCGVSKTMRNRELISPGYNFDVEIKIIPENNNISAASERIPSLIRKLFNIKFDGKKLERATESKIYIQNGNNHKTHYDIEKDLQSIKPTIYLEEEGISIDEETGQPNFEQIKTFALDLIEEIKEEYNGNENIEEL